MIDRSEINRALAKAIAYKQCGKDDKAAAWAAILVDMLACQDILQPQWRTMGDGLTNALGRAG